MFFGIVLLGIVTLAGGVLGPLASPAPLEAAEVLVLAEGRPGSYARWPEDRLGEVQVVCGWREPAGEGSLRSECVRNTGGVAARLGCDIRAAGAGEGASAWSARCVESVGGDFQVFACRVGVAGEVLDFQCQARTPEGDISWDGSRLRRAVVLPDIGGAREVADDGSGCRTGDSEGLLRGLPRAV